jgi:REP element-mobilizing transposase RayT
MGRDAVTLCADERDIVLATILSVSRHERWTVYAAHVRSTHVHVVVNAAIKPEAVMGNLKAYSSRALNRSLGTQTKRWSRHGSTVYLWDVHLMRRAVDYVVRGQGPTMSCYVNAAPAARTNTTEP